MAEEQASEESGESSGEQSQGIQLPEGFQIPKEFEGLEKFYSVGRNEETGEDFFDWESTAAKTALSYKELQGKLGERESEVRGRLENEIRSEIHGELPADAGGYEATTPDLGDVQIPDGWEMKEPEGPLTDAWKEMCFNNKLGKDIFQAGIDMMTKIQLAELPNLTEVNKAIGENAAERMKTVAQRLTGMFGEEASEALLPSIRTNADGFKAMESLIEKAVLGMEGGGEGGEGDPGGSSIDEINEEVDRLMQDPRYRNGDEEINTKVGKLLDAKHRMLASSK